LLAEPGQALTVGVVPLRLPENVFVPAQAVMFQLTQNGVCRTGNFTGRIDIFNANEPFTLTGAGLQVAAERGN